MPRYYFDCLSNGVLHADEFGVDLPEDEVADQAQAVMMNLLEESLPNTVALLVMVMVRAERGRTVYVAHGIVGGSCISETSVYFMENPAKN
jgi:predicted anti-sigma-YlaC factor YlaD